MVGILLSYWDSAYFQVRTVSFREGSLKISSLLQIDGCLVTLHSHNHGSMENRALEDEWLVSKIVIFHLHDCWRKSHRNNLFDPPVLET